MMKGFLNIGIAAAFSLASIAAQAQQIPQPVAQELNQLDQSVAKLDAQINRVPVMARHRVSQRLSQTLEKLSLLLEKLQNDQIDLGFWVQADRESCNAVCARQGLRPGFSPEGAQCVSGESRAASAIGQIDFKYGCWGGCTAQAPTAAESVGAFCYSPGQKRDNDKTDRTVGCFCDGPGRL